MVDATEPAHPPGKHRYTSVVQGVEFANVFARSRLSTAEFARQRRVSGQMVRYWCGRARRLAAASKPDLVQVAELSADGVVALAPTPAALPAPMPATANAPSTASPIAAPTIELRLPNGVRIGIGAGFSPQVLSQVIVAEVGRRGSYPKRRTFAPPPRASRWPMMRMRRRSLDGTI